MKKLHPLILTVLLLSFCFSVANAQTSFAPKSAKATVKMLTDKVKAPVGGEAKIRFSISPIKDWYAYGLKETNGMPISIKTPSIKGISFGKPSESPKAKKVYDDGFEADVYKHTSTVTITVPVKIDKSIKIGSKSPATIKLDFQTCSNITGQCIPEADLELKTTFEFVEDTSKTESAIVDGKTEEADKTEVAETTPTTDTSKAAVVSSGNNNSDKSGGKAIAANVAGSKEAVDNPGGKGNANRKDGILGFLWIAIVAGATSLLTPCVFPMIPITVSFFTKRAEKKTKGLVDSIAYGLGIMSTFTILGVILAAVLGPTGVGDFATNPWVNIFIATIFFIFAFNLFGAFEIQIPTKILNKLNMASRKNGIFSVILMGLTFSLTSFTCTVPFVGTALISASDGEWFYPIIGMLAFSGTFAIPFFLLSLFPRSLSSLPKAGGWMNNLKVVMGFLEIAAALKFVSNVDLVWGWGILSRELFLSVWIGCCILSAIYLLGFFRMPLDTPLEKVGALRAVFVIVFMTCTFYFLSGLFGKPLGELDAFLPPDNYRELMNGAGSNMAVESKDVVTHKKVEAKDYVAHDNWHSDYKAALAESKKTKKPIFVDFTGFTCTNCRWMEKNMFVKNAVKERLEQYVKVQLYTDRPQEPYVSNKRMQLDRFRDVALPLYVIISPDDKTIATISYTRSEEEFVSFLDKGISPKVPPKDQARK
jgi:thiol:disulfide interchange protein